MTPTTLVDDPHWMRLALEQARLAAQVGEVAVGAVVVHNGVLVGAGHNITISTNDPSAHAEMVALRRAAERLGNYRLPDCELFVTLEPCVMCAGAMLHARLKRVVYGTTDPKTGAAGSVLNVFSNAALNHHTQVQGGVMATECAAPLKRFFSAQRQQQAIHRQQSGAALREDALRTSERFFEHLSGLTVTSCYAHSMPALAGLRLHYLDTMAGGEVNAVVALHGPDGWSLAWRQELAHALALGQRMVCPDLIGFGRSDKPKKAAVHTLAWHASYLAQWLDHLGLFNVTLITPAAMKPLVHDLQQIVGQRIRSVDVREPEALTPQERDAPFPDNGHRAAVRAFNSLLS